MQVLNHSSLGSQCTKTDNCFIKTGPLQYLQDAFQCPNLQVNIIIQYIQRRHRAHLRRIFSLLEALLRKNKSKQSDRQTSSRQAGRQKDESASPLKSKIESEHIYCAAARRTLLAPETNAFCSVANSLVLETKALKMCLQTTAPHSYILPMTFKKNSRDCYSQVLTFENGRYSGFSIFRTPIIRIRTFGRQLTSSCTFSVPAVKTRCGHWILLQEKDLDQD